MGRPMSILHGWAEACWPSKGSAIGCLVGSRVVLKRDRRRLLRQQATCKYRFQIRCRRKRDKVTGTSFTGQKN